MSNFQSRRTQKSFRWFLAIGLLLPSLAVAQTPEQPTYLMEIGLAQAAFSNVNRNDALAAYRAFLENIGRRLGYKMRVEAKIYDNTAQFGAVFKQGALHLAVMDSWQFLELDPQGDVRPMFVPLIDGRLGRRFLVLVRRDSDIHTMADLRGRSVVRTESLNNNVCRGWLKTLLPLEPGRPASDFFESLESAAKPAAAVLPVFFGQKDACIVDERGFELMKELNPQVGRVLGAIATSDVLVDLVVCMSERNWPTPETRAVTVKAIANLAADPAGQQILALFKISGLVPYQEEQLTTVRQLRHVPQPSPGTAAAGGDQP